MALTLEEFLFGFLSLLTVLVGITVGTTIASRYFKFKEKKLIMVGISSAGFYEPHWDSGFSFLSALITGEGLTTPLYIFLGNFLIPFSLVLWMYAISDFISIKKKWVLPLIYGIISGIMEIYMFYYLFTDYTVIGTRAAIFDIEYGSIWTLYLMFV